MHRLPSLAGFLGTPDFWSIVADAAYEQNQIDEAIAAGTYYDDTSYADEQPAHAEPVEW